MRLAHTMTAAVVCLATVVGCSDDTDVSTERGGPAASSTTDPAPDRDNPTTTAPAGVALDDPLPVSDDPIDLSAVEPVLDRFLAESGLAGLGLVVVDSEDGIVGEVYRGPFGPDRVSLIASSSKMLSAGILVRLDDEGVLDLDAPVADVAPWGSAHPTVTAAQLLSNSSGLVGLDTDDIFAPYLCQYVAAGSIQACAERIFTTPDDDALVIPPDTEFRYGGGQWQVAGAVAEAASGKTWSQLVTETYVEPCGVDSLGFNNHFSQIVSPNGPFTHPPQFDGDPAVLAPTDNPNPEGGAYIDPRDYATLLLMHLRGGRCGDRQVISEAGIERMHSDRVAQVYGGEASKGRGYGLGWWVVKERPGLIEDPGAFGAVPWLDLERGYGAYLVIEHENRPGTKLAREIRPLIDAAIDARR